MGQGIAIALWSSASSVQESLSVWCFILVNLWLRHRNNNLRSFDSVRNCVEALVITTVHKRWLLERHVYLIRVIIQCTWSWCGRSHGALLRRKIVFRCWWSSSALRCDGVLLSWSTSHAVMAWIWLILVAELKFFDERLIVLNLGVLALFSIAVLSFMDIRVEWWFLWLFATEFFLDEVGAFGDWVIRIKLDSYFIRRQNCILHDLRLESVLEIRIKVVRAGFCRTNFFGAFLVATDIKKAHFGYRDVLEPLHEELVLTRLQEETEDHEDHRCARRGRHRNIWHLVVALWILEHLEIGLHWLQTELQLVKNYLLFLVIKATFGNHVQQLKENLDFFNKLDHFVRHSIYLYHLVAISAIIVVLKAHLELLHNLWREWMGIHY